MKISMPFTPKAKLMDVLARRRQTLVSWVTEMGIKNALQLELYCMRHKLELPNIDELIVAFAPPPSPVVSTFELTVDVEEPKRAKKVKNALVKTHDPGKAEGPPENKTSDA